MASTDSNAKAGMALPDRVMEQVPSPRVGHGRHADEAAGYVPARKSRKAKAKPAVSERAIRSLPLPRAGQIPSANQADAALPARKSRNAKATGAVPERANDVLPSPRAGQANLANSAISVVPARKSQKAKAKANVSERAGGFLPSLIDGTGHGDFALTAKRAAPVPSTFDQLAELQVRRKFYIAAANRLILAGKALARRYLGWRADSNEAAREKINKEAARLIANALKDNEAQGDMLVLREAVAPLQAARDEAEATMRRLVRELPLYAWASHVRGFGELGLAVLLAEAGDLKGYPTKGHLWKRLGLAPHEGKAYSTWRREGGLTADDWVTAGYSPRRRAEMFAVIAEPLIRNNDGAYRTTYDQRRAHTAQTHPDWTKAHSHADALRIMTKALVRDAWRMARQ